jgi:hypothetical protein
VQTILTGVVTKLFRFFTSYSLATALFLFLLLLTYLGTVEQINQGLFLTQKKYFESLFVVHTIFDAIPIVLPGVYLLLILLSINIFLGGIVRMRKGWSQVGVFIAHGGILLLLVGGLITYKFSESGHLTLYEGEQSAVFKSYNEWELAISGPGTDGRRAEYVVDEQVFTGLDENESRLLTSPEWPFSLSLRSFMPNAMPRPAGPMVSLGRDVVDGVFLEPRPLELEQERNTAGLHASVQPQEGGPEQELILWGLQQAPAAIAVNGESWAVDLRRKQWSLPFAVHLNKFVRELHPRTSMPSAFSSDVTKVEGGLEQKVTISMNQPLRHKGFTLYQASWGPQNAGPNDPLFSTLAVVRNPADQFPLYACIVITFGMFVHFTMRLRRHLVAEGKRQNR